jgi:DNA-binding MarR family transcriptional regulator
VDSREDLERQVMMAARESNISSILFRNATARRLGLNITDSVCLSVLAITGVSSPTELARYTGLTSGAATAMLDRLEKADFIRRKPNPEDRRGTLIEITDTWTEKAGRLVSGIQESQMDLVASYSARELEIIADFLTRFADNVKEHTGLIEQDLT